MIQRAVSADLAGLQAIERASAIHFPPGRIPDLDDVMPAGDLQNAIDQGLLFVATDGDVVVGFAMANVLDDALHLAVMAVHPEHGNRGLGRALVLALLHEAVARGYPQVTLTTFADLPFNGPFYRKAGFRALSDAQLSPALREILDHESALGMVNRVAMHWTFESRQSY